VLKIPFSDGLADRKEAEVEKQERVRRIRTIEGHVRGIERMMEEDAYCIDVIRQIQAVQSALTKVSVDVLDEHLQTCLINAVQGNNGTDKDQLLKEITEVYEMASKV
jgi:DNA-binding FrmR family transcriptional regulator